VLHKIYHIRCKCLTDVTEWLVFIGWYIVLC